jgi:hypothetical protein
MRLISILISLILVISPCKADAFLSAQVKDISDRNYETSVTGLLESAKKSITISMYTINVTEHKKNSINKLLEGLLQARKRGVLVDLYLNTNFRDLDENKGLLITHSALKQLENAGCIIHLIPENRMLHDKLVIVDNRYIAEGSTNWSISGFRRNFESSTLIDSKDLAEIKLQRLKTLLIKAEPKPKHIITPYYAQGLPKRLSIANTLLLDRQYFSQMVTRHDGRAFDLYLLLLAHSQKIGKDEFFLSLEDMALSLGLSDTLSNTALRRQVIRSLRILKDRYKLIDVEFFYAKNAYVTMSSLRAEGEAIISPYKKSSKPLSFPARGMSTAGHSSLRATEGSEAILSPNKKASQTFPILTDSIINNKALTLRSKFLLLIKAHLKANGESLSLRGAEGDAAISIAELSRRFGIDESVLRKAEKDLDLLD